MYIYDPPGGSPPQPCQLWVYLNAVLVDENNNIVEIGSEEQKNVLWSADVGTFVYPYGSHQEYECPEIVDKYTITATYKQYTDTVFVIKYKRVFMSSVNSGCVSGLTLRDYSYTFTDLQVTNVEGGFNITAPGGIALVEKRPHVYLDAWAINQLGTIREVPTGLTWETSVFLDMDDTGIYIVKEANGSGYAKIAFCNGLNGPGWIENGMDVWLIYSSNNQFIAF